MRRRRNRLEVTTFPFLAVLLCAMGSLILILLVMDRRAKAAAVERAQKALAEQLARQQEEAEARRELHARLLEEQKRKETERLASLEERKRTIALQQQEITEKRTALKTQSDEKTRQLTAAQADAARQQLEMEKLRQQLLEERNRLLKQESEVESRRLQVEQTSKQADSSRADLIRLNQELELLERTIAQLKESRQREQQTYSIVPYKGSRGDNRRPIYLECMKDGMMFHPDRQEVNLNRELNSRLIDLVKERHNKVRAQAKPEEKDAKKPYLLFLVRPDAIATYYGALDALTDYSFDYGYELIGADWELAFPESEGDKAPIPPWTIPKPVPPAPAPDTAPKGNRPPLVGYERGGTGGNSGPSGNAGVGSVPGSATSGLPLQLPSESGFGRPREGTGDFQGSRTQGGTGVGERGTGGATAYGSGTNNRGIPAGPQGSDSSASGSQLRLPPTGTGGGTAESGVPTRPGQNSTGVGGNTASSPPSGNPGGSEPGLLSNLVQPTGPGQAQPGQTQPRSTQAPGQHTETPEKAQSNQPNGSSTSSPNSPQTSNVQGSPGSQTPPSESQPGGTVGAGTPSSGVGLPSNGSDVNAPRPPVAFVGNRDWIIPIECTAGGVILYPNRFKIDLAGLARGTEPSAALLQNVKDSIERRQAGVRPGEPPYRPIVRFLIRPDGLQSFHKVYPLIKVLNLPMHRVDLDHDEELGAAIYKTY